MPRSTASRKFTVHPLSPRRLTIRVERPRDRRVKAPPAPAAVRSNAWLDDPRTEYGVATPCPMEIGCLSGSGVASAGGESRRPQGRSAAHSVGVEPHGARSGAHRASVAPRPATRVPPGPACGCRRPCARSCHLLPTGCVGRGDTGSGDEGRAHQPLPTDRTAGWLFLSPACALAWRIPHPGALYRLLA
jgi:hypothetical protein